MEDIIDNYTKIECEDVKESKHYLVSEIKHLIKETYRDGLNKGIELYKKDSDRYHQLNIDIRNKLGISGMQTIDSPEEIYIIGELVAYHFGFK